MSRSFLRGLLLQHTTTNASIQTNVRHDYQPLVEISAPSQCIFEIAIEWWRLGKVKSSLF